MGSHIAQLPIRRNLSNLDLQVRRIGFELEEGFMDLCRFEDPEGRYSVEPAGHPEL